MRSFQGVVKAKKRAKLGDMVIPQADGKAATFLYLDFALSFLPATPPTPNLPNADCPLF